MKRKLYILPILILAWMSLCGFQNVNNKAEVRWDNGKKIYIVGDSRTYNARFDTRDRRVNWLAKAGSSYYYFENTFVPLLDQEELAGKTIVIMYGINDIMQEDAPHAIYNWTLFFRDKAQEWIKRGATVKVCTVPGVDYKLCNSLAGEIDEANVDLLNQNVATFNENLERYLPENIECIHVPHYEEDPYSDGIHYTKQESIKIYRALIDYLVWLDEQKAKKYRF